MTKIQFLRYRHGFHIAGHIYNIYMQKHLAFKYKYMSSYYIQHVLVAYGAYIIHELI